jgi:hypothetical protein
VLAAILTSTLLLGPPVQRPSDAPLTWNAPLECPSPEDVLARVHALAPGVLVDSERARVSASVEVVEIGYQLELVLRTDDDTIRRTLIGSDCEEVSDAVALLVAVLLDPIASAREVQLRHAAVAPSVAANEAPANVLSEQLATADDPPDDPSVSPTSSTGEGGVSASAEPRRSQTRRDVRAGLRIAGGGGYGPTTSGFADLGGSVSVFGDRWRVELGGAWTPSRELVREGVGGRFDAWRVSARGCFVPTLGARDRLELPLCPGVEVGQVRGQGPRWPTDRARGQLPLDRAGSRPGVELRLW